jgi:hypothetical protein
VYDGSVWKALRAKFDDRPGVPALEQFMAWKMTNDPCELGENEESWLPVFFVCMSLPPWMRRVLGAMHLGLLLPPGVKNLQLVMPYFLEHLRGPQGVQVVSNVFIIETITITIVSLL